MISTALMLGGKGKCYNCYKAKAPSVYSCDGSRWDAVSSTFKDHQLEKSLQRPSPQTDSEINLTHSHICF